MSGVSLTKVYLTRRFGFSFVGCVQVASGDNRSQAMMKEGGFVASGVVSKRSDQSRGIGASTKGKKKKKKMN